MTAPRSSQGLDPALIRVICKKNINQLTVGPFTELGHVLGYQLATARWMASHPSVHSVTKFCKGLIYPWEANNHTSKSSVFRRVASLENFFQTCLCGVWQKFRHQSKHTLILSLLSSTGQLIPALKPSSSPGICQVETSVGGGRGNLDTTWKKSLFNRGLHRTERETLVG